MYEAFDGVFYEEGSKPSDYGVVENTTKPIPDVSHLKGMSVKACPEPSQETPVGVFEEMCDWYANGTIVWTPKVIEPVPIVQGTEPKRLFDGYNDVRANRTFDKIANDVCPTSDYFMGYVEGCTLEYQICWERALQQTAVKPVVESAKIACQSNDDFCTPGCELIE